MENHIATAAVMVAALVVYGLATSLLRDYCTRREVALAAVGAVLLFGSLLFVDSRYATGEGQSILNVFLPASLFGLFWGLGLVLLAMLPSDSLPPPARKQNSFRAFIEKQLPDFYADMEDPAARGVADARHKGGPFPATTDARPLPGGYEDGLRKRYESMAGMYLQTFITGLLDGLQKGLGVIERLNKEIEPGWYAQQARNFYKQGIKDIRPDVLLAAAQEYKRSGDERKEFEDSCQLRPGEKIEHFPRTSGLKLGFILLFFGAAQFGLFLFLLNETHRQQGLHIALFAVLASVFIGFAMGFFRQWTRRNKGAFTRMAARTAVALFALSYAAGLGFLMGWAPEPKWGESTAAVAQGIFLFVSQGFRRLGAEQGLVQLALLLGSVGAFSVIAWHISHRFNKFHPRDAFVKQEKKARARWLRLTEKIERNGDEAVSAADADCQSGQRSAAQSRQEIQAGQKTLDSITQDAAGVFRSIFQPQFEEDIRAYREANANARSDIFQPPDYFSDPAPQINFNKIVQEIGDTHLNDLPSGAEFERAEQHFNRLQDEARKWEKVRPELQEAFLRFDKEAIAAATVGKEPQHESWVLERIGMSAAGAPVDS